jgi:predicted RNase H-like HicB family nuclease
MAQQYYEAGRFEVMAGQLTFAVIVEKGKHNFSAYAPELPGCVTTGNTVEETLANMREAISFHLRGMAEDQRPLPTSSIVSTQLLSFDVPEQSI